MDTSDPSDAVQASAEATFQSIQPSSAAMAVVLIQDAIRLGQPDLAQAFVRAARKRWSSEPALCLMQTMLEARNGRLEDARQALATAEQLAAETRMTQMYSALLAMESCEPLLARSRLRALIETCPDYPGVAGMLASLLMPGPNYRDVLRCLHRILAPRGYLEVGVETGATLGLAGAERIVGIDPDLGPLRRERLAAHAEVFELTSQDFFAQYGCEQVMGKIPLDLVFIDGLHRFEAALADFHAVEHWAHADTVVILHDALPIAKVYAEAQRRTRFWVGDVWKAVVVLLRHRPDLSIRIIPTPPSGLVVIRWRKAPRTNGTVDLSRMIAQTEFPSLAQDDPVWPREFHLVTNDVNGYSEALSR